MKPSLLFAAGLATLGLVSNARADVFSFKGSDTLFGVVTEAVAQLGLAGELLYTGGGSGQGEKALVAGTQGIAPMSRAASPEAIKDAAAKGIVLTNLTIGLDGVAVLAHASNTVSQIRMEELRSIFAGPDGLGTPASCSAATRITDWSKVAGSTKAGPVKAFRRNDDSGTTDTFKSLVGIKAFCPDVTVRVTSDDLATETTANADAIAYSGLSAERPTKNKALPVLDAAKGVAVAPSADTIRAFTYPLARRLYVTVASGSHSPNAAEDRLLQNLLDPSFVDPILAAHEFITCPVTGCP